MKKILILLFLLLCFITSEAQVLNASPAYHKYAPAAGGYCAEYQAVYDAMTTPPGADTAAQQDLMLSRIVDTADLDLLYVFAQSYNSDGEADINWINPGTFDLIHAGSGSLTWTKYRGYNGNGTSYLRTGYNPSINKIKFSLNSGSVGGYVRENINEETYLLCADDATQRTHLVARYDGQHYVRINQESSDGYDESDGDGFWIDTRVASNNIDYYHNGIKQVDGTTVSSALPNDELEIFSRNGGYISTNEISIIFVAEGLTGQQIAEISDAVNDYMTYLGKNVY
jgi:hypothetical protein